jgi:hypothetical protein
MAFLKIIILNDFYIIYIYIYILLLIKGISKLSKSYQGLNLGLQGHNALPLPSNHFIYYKTNGVMIGFIMLFIPNALQKPTLDIIFLMNKLQSKRFSHDVHIFNIINK